MGVAVRVAETVTKLCNRSRHHAEYRAKDERENALLSGFEEGNACQTTNNGDVV